MIRTREPSGFTLVELMVVVALLAIFSAIAVPSFNRLINNNRTQSSANELQALMQYARGYAVENRTDVSVCFAAGGLSVRTSCATAQALRVLEPQGVVFNASSIDLQFRSNGSASAASTYTVCRNGDFANGFTATVDRSGQVRLFPRGQQASGAAMSAC